MKTHSNQKTKMDIYEPLREVKAKLRLYLNDKAISQYIIESLDCPIPIEIDGTMIVGKKDGKMHIFFVHNKPESFIPVFLDYEGDFKEKHEDGNVT